MSDLKLSTHGGLVETTIRAKQETYYLVTRDNVSSIKSKSLLSDLFVFLASLSWGAYFSVVTTIKSIPKPTVDSDPVNKILLPLLTMENIFLVASILFSILTIIMVYVSYSSLTEIKKSGKVDLNKAVDQG
jgi:drug/metabolite transporter (DMT)-like permease